MAATCSVVLLGTLFALSNQAFTLGDRDTAEQVGIVLSGENAAGTETYAAEGPESVGAPNANRETADAETGDASSLTAVPLPPANQDESAKSDEAPTDLLAAIGAVSEWMDSRSAADSLAGEVLSDDFDASEFPNADYTPKASIARSEDLLVVDVEGTAALDKDIAIEQLQNAAKELDADDEQINEIADSLFDETLKSAETAIAATKARPAATDLDAADADDAENATNAEIAEEVAAQGASAALDAARAATATVLAGAAKGLSATSQLAGLQLQSLDTTTASTLPRSDNSNNIEYIKVKWVTDDDSKPETLELKPLEDTDQYLIAQIDYGLSGEADYAPGAVRICIPAHYFHSRYDQNNYEDVVVLPFPQAPSTTGEFNWTLKKDSSGNEYYELVNTRTLSAATKGFIQVGISQVTPHRIVDRQLTEPFEATIQVTTVLENELGANSNKINALIDTYQEAVSATKLMSSYSLPRVQTGQDIINMGGVLPAGYSATDYFVVVEWNIKVNHKGNQEFTITATDTTSVTNASNSASGLPQGFVVRTTVNGTTKATGSASTTYNMNSSTLGKDMFSGWQADGDSSYYYVTTAYPVYSQNMSRQYLAANTNYRLRNSVTFYITENDTGRTTYKTSSDYHAFKWTGPKFDWPNGHFYLYKTGNDGEAAFNDEGAESPYYQHARMKDTGEIKGRSFTAGVTKGDYRPNAVYGMYEDGLNALSGILGGTTGPKNVDVAYTLEAQAYGMPWTYNGNVISDYYSTNPSALQKVRRVENYGYNYYTTVLEDTGITMDGETLQPLRDYTFKQLYIPRPMVGYAKAANMSVDGQLVGVVNGVITNGQFNYFAAPDYDAIFNQKSDGTQVAVGSAEPMWLDIEVNEGGTRRWIKNYAKLQYTSTGENANAQITYYTESGAVAATETGTVVTGPGGALPANMTNFRVHVTSNKAYYHYHVLPTVTLLCAETSRAHQIAEAAYGANTDNRTYDPLLQVKNAAKLDKYKVPPAVANNGSPSSVDTIINERNGVEEITSNAASGDTLKAEGVDYLNGYLLDVMAIPTKDGESISATYEDIVAGFAKVHYSAGVKLQSFIPSQTTYEEELRLGTIPYITKGIWYDLLPQAAKVDASTITVRAGDAVTRTYQVPNYNGSGRTLLVVEVDLAPQPTEYKRSEDSLLSYFEDTPTIEFDVRYPLTALVDYGKTLHNVIAFEAVEDGGGALGAGDSTRTKPADRIGTVPGYRGEADDPNGTQNVSTPLATDTQPASIGQRERNTLVDLNPSHDRPTFVYAGDTTEVRAPAAATTSLSKAVTVNDENWYTTGLDADAERVVYTDGVYNYRLRVGSGPSSKTSNIVIYDTLESYIPGMFENSLGQEDENKGNPQWHGRLESAVDVGQFTDAGCEPVVYYSTYSLKDDQGATYPAYPTGQEVQNSYPGEGPTLAAYSNTATSDQAVMPKYRLFKADGTLNSHNPNDPESWPVENLWVRASEYTGSLADVTMVAIDARHKPDGSAFVLEPDKTLVAYLYMHAPNATSDEYNQTASKYVERNAHAYNNVYLTATTFDADDPNQSEASAIRNDYTKVGLRDFAIWASKDWQDDDNRDGKRAEAVRMKLYCTEPVPGSEPVDTGKAIWIYENGYKVDVNGEPSGELLRENVYDPATGKYVTLPPWTGAFTGISATNGNGVAYVYTIQEDQESVGFDEGDTRHYYTPSVLPDGSFSFGVQNYHEPFRTSISGAKSWQGDSDEELAAIYGEGVHTTEVVRPKQVRLKLYRQKQLDKEAGKKPVYDHTETIVPAADGSWKYSFDNLYKYENGELLTWTVEEVISDPSYTPLYYTNPADLDWIKNLSSAEVARRLRTDPSVARYKDPTNGLYLLNVYAPYGDVVFTKTLDNAISQASRNVEFNFEVLFERALRTGYRGYITGYEPSIDPYEYVIYERNTETGAETVVSQGAFANNTAIVSGASIKLKGNQYVRFLNLPGDMRVTLTETEAAGYTSKGGISRTTTVTANTEPVPFSSEKKNSAVFTNMYSTQGSTSLEAHKVLQGRRTMNPYEFQFDLVQLYNDGAEVTLRTTQASAAEDANPTDTETYAEVPLGVLQYSNNPYKGVAKDAAEGRCVYDAASETWTYTYEIRERDRGKGGYTYDHSVFRVEVAVKDNGNGTMAATPTYYFKDANDEWTTFDPATSPYAQGHAFSNIYEAKGEWSPRAWKVLEGRELAETDKFTFEMLNMDGTPVYVREYTDDAGTPDDTTDDVQKLRIVNVSEGDLVDNQDGTYTFTPTGGTAQDAVTVKPLVAQSNAEGQAQFGTIGFTLEQLFAEENTLNSAELVNGAWTYRYVVREHVPSAGSGNDPSDPDYVAPDADYDPQIEYDKTTLRGYEVQLSDQNTGTLKMVQKFINVRAREGEGETGFEVYEKAAEEGSQDTSVYTDELPIFANKLKPGKLEVTKSTQWASQHSPDPNQTFKFRVRLTGPSVKDGEIAYEISNTDSNPGAYTANGANSPGALSALALPAAPSDASGEAAEGEELEGSPSDIVSEAAELIRETVVPLAGTGGMQPQATNTVVASGTSGGVTWTVYSDGELVFSPTNGVSGQLLSVSGSLSNLRPWYQNSVTYNGSTVALKDFITSVRFTGQITCGENSLRQFFGSNTDGQGLNKITSIDFSGLNTSGAKNMEFMFSHCNSLASLNLSNFNTANATSMQGMFYKCANLASLNISSFNTANVTTMRSMFYGCEKLPSITFPSNFNTAKVTDMTIMFRNCKALTSLNLSSFNTGKVTTMESMFSGCSGLTSLSFPSSFNTANVTKMNSMFSGCSGLTLLDVSNFNTLKVTSMSNMFNGCSGLTSLNLANFNTPALTSCSYMFTKCTNLEELDISQLNTTQIDSLQDMFGAEAGSITPKNKNLRKITVGNYFAPKGTTASAPSSHASSLWAKFGFFGHSGWYWKSAQNPAVGLKSSKELVVDYTTLPPGTWERAYLLFARYESNPGTSEQELVTELSAETTAPYSIENPPTTFIEQGHAQRKYFDKWEIYNYKDPNTTDSSYTTMIQELGAAGVPIQTGSHKNAYYIYPGTVIPAGALSSASVTLKMRAIWADMDRTAMLANGEFEFELKGGQKATIPDIPAGAAYQVWEETPAGWVLVQSVDETGKIKTLETAQAKFTNEYVVGRTEARIQGTKTMDGVGADADAFQFKLVPCSVDATGLMIADMPMPTGAGLSGAGAERSYTMTNAEGGAVQFPTIEYDRAGVYTYQVLEVAGSDPGISYDNSVWTVTVTVTDQGGGVLSSTVAYAKGEAGARAFSFANESNLGSLRLTKNVTAGSPDATGNQAFTFTLRIFNERGIPLPTGTSLPYNVVDAQGNSAEPVEGKPAANPDTSITTHTVTFRDGYTEGDAGILKTQTVMAGKGAAAPAVGLRQGYVFANWDTDYSNVTSDLVVSATWTEAAGSGSGTIPDPVPDPPTSGWAAYTANGSALEYVVDASGTLWLRGDGDGTGVLNNGQAFSGLGDAAVTAVRVVPGETIKLAGGPLSTEMTPFANWTNLAKFYGDGFDVSERTSLVGLFRGMSKLEVIDLSTWDVSNVTSMARMFQNTGYTGNDTSRELHLDLSAWGAKTAKVTDLSRMFGDTNAKTVNMSGWDVRNVTTTYQMFANGNNNKLQEIDFSGWNTASLTDNRMMFGNSAGDQTPNLRRIVLSDTFKVANASDAKLNQTDGSASWVRLEDGEGPYDSTGLFSLPPASRAGTWVWKSVYDSLGVPAETQVDYYKVAYMPNGATAGSMETVTQDRASAYSLASCGYSRPGYDFAGWNTAADGTGTQYAANGRVLANTQPANSALALYAQWTLADRAITLTDGTGTVLLRAGETLTIPNLPAGYTYEVEETNVPTGWKLDSAQGDVVSDDKSVSGGIAAGISDKVGFTNSYDAEGSAAPMAYKRFDGANIEDGQFSFTLSDAKGTLLETVANGPVSTDDLIVNPAPDAPNDPDADGYYIRNPYKGLAPAAFGEQRYKLSRMAEDVESGLAQAAIIPGDGGAAYTIPDAGDADVAARVNGWVYTYTIREVKGTDGTIVYDESVKTVRVLVTDTGTGKLATQMLYEEASSGSSGGEGSTASAGAAEGSSDVSGGTDGATGNGASGSPIGSAIFVNSLNPGDMELTKTLEGADASPAASAAEFAFTIRLVDNMGNPLSGNYEATLKNTLVEQNVDTTQAPVAYGDFVSEYGPVPAGATVTGTLSATTSAKIGGGQLVSLADATVQWAVTVNDLPETGASYRAYMSMGSQPVNTYPSKARVLAEANSGDMTLAGMAPIWLVVDADGSKHLYFTSANDCATAMGWLKGTGATQAEINALMVSYNGATSIRKDVAGESVSFDASGVATVTLKGGETLHLEGLPDGASYTVVETEKPGYDLTASSNADDATIHVNETTQTSFTNTYEAEGEIPVSAKKALVSQDDPTVEREPRNEIFYFSLYDDADGKPGNPVQSGVTNDATGAINFDALQFTVDDLAGGTVDPATGAISKTFTYWLVETTGVYLVREGGASGQSGTATGDNTGAGSGGATGGSEGSDTGGTTTGEGDASANAGTGENTRYATTKEVASMQFDTTPKRVDVTVTDNGSGALDVKSKVFGSQGQDVQLPATGDDPNKPKFVNKTAESGELKIYKTGNGEALPNATFQLWRVGAGVVSEMVASAHSDSNGLLAFEDIAPGTYELRETVAPSGFTKIDPLTVKVAHTGTVTVNDKDGNEIALEDVAGEQRLHIDNKSSGFELPATGGPGALVLLAGFALLVATFALLRRRLAGHG